MELETKKKPKRNRIKLMCKCGQTFNDDYRTTHEKLKHNGQRMPVKHVGAPENPFVLAKKKYNTSKKLVSRKIEIFSYC